jgi:heptosyltransferase III
MKTSPNSPNDTQHFKKILIIATRQIGDTLITTPLIKRTHEIWPDAQIDFLGFKSAIGILEGNPHLHEIIGSSPKPKIKEYLHLLKKVFFKYDLAIITQPSDRSYLYGLFAATKRVGVMHVGQEDHGWKKWITQYQVPINYFEQHVVTEKLRLVDPFTKGKQITQEIVIDAPSKVSPSLVANEIAPNSVLIHPSPLNAYKKWPLSHWLSVIEFLSDQHIPVLISGGAAKVDVDLAQEIIKGLSQKAKNQVINLTGKVSFSELATLLRQVRAYVGVDTSVTHLAAACNTPTVALFGATPPTNFGPWPNGFSGKQPYQIRALSQTVSNVTILQGPNACVPCRKAGCDDHANSRSLCLEELDSTRVIQALQKILQLNIN